MLHCTCSFLLTLRAATTTLTTLFMVYMLPLGSRFVEGKVVVVEEEVVVVEEEVGADMAVAGDRRMAAIIQAIANSIEPTVRMEVDFPSNYEDGWMPLLDLQVRETGNNLLLYKFYSKKVSNPLLILIKSACRPGGLTGLDLSAGDLCEVANRSWASLAIIEVNFM